MPRASKTGVRGLYYDEAEKRFRIDFRWREARTGKIDRYRERFPEGTKKPAAERRARDVINLAIAGKLKQAQDGPGTLKVALNRYLDFVETELGARARKDRGHHADLLVAELNAIPLVDLSPIHIERYKATRRKATRAARGKQAQRAKGPEPKPISPATINRELATLKHFVGKAADWGWLDEAQAVRLRKVRLLKEPPGRVRWLTEDERAKLYAVLPEGFRRMVVADALSGLRRGELVGLTKGQVDLKKRLLTLTKTKSNRTRHVPINDALATVLKEAMAASEGSHVFESRHRVAYTPSGVSSFFRKLAARAGIRDFHLHDLRHDFATQVRRAGSGIDVVGKLLGHATLAMAQRYAHLGDDEMRKAVEAIAPTLPTASVKPVKKSRKTA